MWERRRWRINVGYIVLVQDPKLKRNYWKLGKIKKLIKGHVESVRAATVKIYKNNSIHQLINRPISKLYPLEIEYAKLHALRALAPTRLTHH